MQRSVVALSVVERALLDTFDGVTLGERLLLVGEGFERVADLPRDRILADVVQQRGHAEVGERAAIHLEEMPHRHRHQRDVHRVRVSELVAVRQ